MFKAYKNWLKILSRKPLNIFWILLFPIILITLFKMTMGSEDVVSSFSEKVKLDFIKTSDETINTLIENAFSTEEFKNYCELNISNNIEISQEKIDKEEIDGYFYIEENENKTYTLVVKTGYSSFANSMIQSFAENFVNTANKIYNVLLKPVAGESQEIRQGNYTKSGDKIFKQENVPSLASLYTYPAITYSILFTGLIVQHCIRSMSSNMSYTGMRIELSNEKKSKTLIGAILATFTIGFIALILLTLYIQFVMKIDLGLTKHIGYLLAIYAVGLIVSILLSSMIILLTYKKDEATQGNVLSGVLLLMYFLSGGMVSNLSLTIKKFLPFLYYINPAALISDSINYLSYKSDLSIVLFNLILIALSGLVYLAISIIALRRKKNELF